MINVYFESSADFLAPVAIGKATHVHPRFLGDIGFFFEDQRREIRFDWISSFVGLDEMICDKGNFPFSEMVDFKFGLYQVFGSNYLDMIKKFRQHKPTYFTNHNHYIYFDYDIFWSITAKGIIEENLD